MRILARVLMCVLAFAAVAAFAPGAAAINLPPFTPSDTFPTLAVDSGDYVIDLGAAQEGKWSDVSAGNGIYDANEWAIVFKYPSVTIPRGVTIAFKNHFSGAPVIWLVQGDVTITGAISLSGGGGHAGGASRVYAEPGPGGFRGGIGGSVGIESSAGFGPGGALTPPLAVDPSQYEGFPGGGSYATRGWDGNGLAGKVYGNPGVFPLIGGSGAAGDNRGYGSCGGGAGGGAILIASAATIDSRGTIRANGGDVGSGNNGHGAGSGGGIRLIAQTFTGNGMLQALGGSSWEGIVGGLGRIRVEAAVHLSLAEGQPPASRALLDANDAPVIFKGDTTPSVKPVKLGDMFLNSEIFKDLHTLPGDVHFDVEGQQVLVVESRNVPIDDTWAVDVRIVRASGADEVVPAVVQPGSDVNLAEWHASIDLKSGFSSIQARAHVKP